MIISDVNLIAYFFIEGEHTAGATAVYQHDPFWVAPPQWRAEFLNVLATHVRAGLFSLDFAMNKPEVADILVTTSDQTADDRAIIELSVRSLLATYDCCFVHLEMTMQVLLITLDRAVIKAFPEAARSIHDFAA